MGLSDREGNCLFSQIFALNLFEFHFGPSIKLLFAGIYYKLQHFGTPQIIIQHKRTTIAFGWHKCKLMFIQPEFSSPFILFNIYCSMFLIGF